MSLEKIIAKINTECQEECDALVKQAQVQADAILAQARTNAETTKKHRCEKGQEEAKRLNQRLLQSADLNARKEILAVKQALLEEIFSQALEKLTNLSKEKYSTLMKNMLLAQPLTGDEQVVVASSDAKQLGKDFLPQVNKELKKNGKKNQLTLVSDATLPRGGFVLRRNMVESNNLLTGLLRAQRDDLELNVAQVLFA